MDYGNYKLIKYWPYSFLCFAIISIPPPVLANDQNAAILLELKKIIKQQQQQIDSQQLQLRSQAKAIKELQKSFAAIPAGNSQAQDNNSIKAVLQNKDKVDVTLYGQVNRAIMYVDDGKNSGTRHVDGDTSATRIGIKAKTSRLKNFEAGAKIEIEYQSNGSNVMSMTTNSDNPGFNERYLDFYLKSKTMGTLSIGQGDTASNGSSEMDFYESALAGIISYGYYCMAGSYQFYNKSAGDYTTASGTIADFFSHLDGLHRKDRLRYDTPSFAGVTLSGSITEKNGNDLAIRYDESFSGFKLKAAMAYAHPGEGTDYDQFNGSISVKLDSGLSLSMATGIRDYDDGSNQDSTFYYGKLGYETNFFPSGSTSCGIDHLYSKDVSHSITVSDKAKSFGIGMVQKIDDWHTELYMAYRLYTLDRDGGIVLGTTYENINVFWSGLRFKF